MNHSDLLNGIIEFLGAIFTLINVRQVLKDKQVKGIHWAGTLFFTTWSSYNLIFYPLNNLWFSFAGAVFLFFANATWVTLLIYYSRRRKPDVDDLVESIEEKARLDSRIALSLSR